MKTLAEACLVVATLGLWGLVIAELDTPKGPLHSLVCSAPLPPVGLAVAESILCASVSDNLPRKIARCSQHFPSNLPRVVHRACAPGERHIPSAQQ